MHSLFVSCRCKCSELIFITATSYICVLLGEFYSFKEAKKVLTRIITAQIHAYINVKLKTNMLCVQF